MFLQNIYLTYHVTLLTLHIKMYLFSHTLFRIIAIYFCKAKEFLSIEPMSGSIDFRLCEEFIWSRASSSRLCKAD